MYRHRTAKCRRQFARRSSGALRDAGASIENIDEDRKVIYAIVSAGDLLTIRHMEGVAYVRVVCNYLADRGIGNAGVLPNIPPLVAAG